jgi:hypothetical protein
VALRDLGTGGEVRLADAWRDRPAVLAFGGWRCDVFCSRVAGLRKLYHDYEGRAEFRFIPVHDGPHPLPAELASAYRKAGLVGQNEDVRRTRLRLAREVMDLPLPCLLDGGEAEKRYQAWPQRLLVVVGGRVVFDAGRGLVNGWNFAAVRACLDARSDAPARHGS